MKLPSTCAQIQACRRVRLHLPWLRPAGFGNRLVPVTFDVLHVQRNGMSMEFADGSCCFPAFSRHVDVLSSHHSGLARGWPAGVFFRSRFHFRTFIARNTDESRVRNAKLSITHAYNVHALLSKLRGCGLCNRRPKQSRRSREGPTEPSNPMVLERRSVTTNVNESRQRTRPSSRPAPELQGSRRARSSSISTKKWICACRFFLEIPSAEFDEQLLTENC